MSFDAYTLKKQYEKACLKQRNKNLIRLREEIARLSQTEFSKQTGIQKSNLSSLESGDRPISLFNIQVYKTYFKDNFDLDVSADFLMGYTDVIENQSMDIANDLGLSNSSISVLKKMSEECHDTLNKLMAENGLFEMLLTELWLYAHNSTYTSISIKNLITESAENITDEKEVDTMMKFKAIDAFNIVLFFIKKAFSDSVSQAADTKLNIMKLEKTIYEFKEKTAKKEKI